MSILDDVRLEFGITESPGTLTEKSSSGSFVSHRSGELKLIPSTIDPHCDYGDVDPKVLEIIRMRERGEIPSHYTSETNCKHCGPVPVWEGLPSDVSGCPWCFNRRSGLPMPSGFLFEKPRPPTDRTDKRG